MTESYEKTPSRSIVDHNRAILLLAFGATMSMVMGVASIIPMVPKLARTFEVGLPQASLVITVFTLPGIVFTLLSGILADRFGRKVVIVPALFLFGCAGVGCAFAPNFETLLALRFLQGIGAAPLGVLNTTILADTWSERSLPRVIGYNMAVLSICTALYPTVGGVLAHFDWRYPFYLYLVAPVIGTIAIFTPLANPASSRSFQEYIGDLARTFRSRRILALLGITAFSFLLLYGPIITCFPILADHNFHAGTMAIGMAMMLSSLGTGLISFYLGRLSDRFSPRNLLLGSLGFYVTALFLMPSSPALWWTLLPIFLYGLGQGLSIPNVQTQLLEAAPADQRASIMSVNGMLLRLGQTLAPVSFSMIAVKHGIDWGFYSGIAVALCMGVLIIFFLPRKQP